MLRASAGAIEKWWRVILLGILTVGSYGIAVYSFGVFIGPIHDDTGWSVGALSGAFTLSSLAGGVGAVGSGWLLDRLGGRPVMLGSLAIGTALLFLASTAESVEVFVIAWGAGGGIISAGLFYNITMALTTRLFPDNRVRAFSILTFVGGFAAVLYFPFAGLLVDLMDWRVALRVLLVLLVLHVLPAALLVRGGAAARGPAAAHATTPGNRPSVLGAFRTPEVLVMIAMFSLASMAFGAIQVLHVPAMTAAGASLGAATAVASVRGLLSLPGRALMGPVVSRFGVPRTMGLTYVLMAVGTLPLAIGGEIWWLLAFLVVTGLAFGTISPLHGLYAADVYGERRIGTLMGIQSLIVSLVSATGPMLMGLTVDATGGYRVAIVLTSALFGGALLLLVARPRGQGVAVPQAAA
ncbi:MAG: MFS transporter [Chloroflexi bacterium]|nr:MFS transporter [Chloroflexota bacterium]